MATRRSARSHSALEQKAINLVRSALPDIDNSSITNGFLADLNGDGIPDLVVSNGSPSTGENIITVLLGNGDGTFTFKSNPRAGNSAGVVAVADVNNDGILDLVVAFSNNFSVRLTRT